VNKNATAWTVNMRQCITCPNPHNEEDLRYKVSFKFAGPDHKEFQKMTSKDRETKRKYVDISKENREKIKFIGTVLCDILEIAKAVS
jgi:hypothetical protein